MTNEITYAEFEKEVLQAEGVVMVDFWAPWCGPCKMLSPIVDELAGENITGTKIYKVNVDDEVEIASQYGVMSIPTLKFFRNGEVVDEVVGMQSKDDLIALLEKNKA